VIDNCCSASCGIKRLRLRASDGTMDSMDTMDDSSCCPRRPWPADDQIGKRHPLVIGRFLLPLQWKPFFVSAMSHPYRVQFFLGGCLPGASRLWALAPGWYVARFQRAILSFAAGTWQAAQTCVFRQSRSGFQPLCQAPFSRLCCGLAARSVT
jgi:hypothetical protein